MYKYKIWDKTSSINGVPAEKILEQFPFSEYDGDIILFYSNNDNNLITSVECKDILSNICNIDKNLSTNEFVAKYFEYCEECKLKKQKYNI